MKGKAPTYRSVRLEPWLCSACLDPVEQRQKPTSEFLPFDGLPLPNQIKEGCQKSISIAGSHSKRFNRGRSFRT